MRIEATQATPPTAAVHGPARAVAARPAAPARRADAVQLSGRGERVRQAQIAARAEAEERARRVADLQAQVKGGTYAVDNVEIAKALLSAV